MRGSSLIFAASAAAAANILYDVDDNLVERQLPATNATSLDASVISVLATAIPASDLSQALTDPNGYSSSLASSLSEGKTPEWYLALPSDVKSYLGLLPASNTAETTISQAQSTPGRSSTATLTGGDVSSTVSERTLARPTGDVTSPTSSSATSKTSTDLTTPPPSSSSPLSTGAKIGIGVSIPSIALIIGAGVVMFFIGKRRGRSSNDTQNTNNAPPGEHPQPIAEYKPELPGNAPQTWPAGYGQQHGQQYGQQQPPYGYVPQYWEMSTAANTHEMQAKEMPRQQ